MSKLIGCKFTKLTDELMFDFEYGSCNTFPSVGILLCWGKKILANLEDPLNKECYLIDIIEGNLRQRKHSWSIYTHHSGSLATYKGFPFITGGSDDLKTEIYDFDSLEWINKADFPTQYTLNTNTYVKYGKQSFR